MPVHKRPTTHLIRTARELRALRTPMRQEIMNAVRRIGPCSAKEIAAETGRAPASLYYHLQRLTEAGLIRVTEERPAGKRLERAYQVSAARIIIDREKRSDAFLAALSDLYGATLRTAERELTRALGRERARKRGTCASTGVIRLQCRMSPESAAGLPERIQELVSSLAEDEGSERGEAYSVTVAVALLPPQ
jgi:DNA-binding transcriptional ArsR family regulator